MEKLQLLSEDDIRRNKVSNCEFLVLLCRDQRQKINQETRTREIFYRAVSADELILHQMNYDRASISGQKIGSLKYSWVGSVCLIVSTLVKVPDATSSTNCNNLSPATSMVSLPSRTVPE